MTDQVMKAAVRQRHILLKFGFIVIWMVSAMELKSNLLIRPARENTELPDMPNEKDAFKIVPGQV